MPICVRMDGVIRKALKHRICSPEILVLCKEEVIAVGARIAAFGWISPDTGCRQRNKDLLEAPAP